MFYELIMLMCVCVSVIDCDVTFIFYCLMLSLCEILMGFHLRGVTISYFFNSL